MTQNHPFSRRRFLRTAGTAAGALTLIPSGVLAIPGRPGANERFVVAHIGVGGMGMTHLNNMLRFQKEGKVKIAAVCDAASRPCACAQTSRHVIGETSKVGNAVRHR